MQDRRADTYLHTLENIFRIMIEILTDMGRNFFPDLHAVDMATFILPGYGCGTDTSSVRLRGVSLVKKFHTCCGGGNSFSCHARLRLRRRLLSVLIKTMTCVRYYCKATAMSTATEHVYLKLQHDPWLV